ncbi:hypothetical protein LXT12_25475 [Pelomonas sp. P7]|uniref:Uncharacterized protein n=1 Tax=Pelomonas caseinilytica TaxID=2906763 RepID=A0ABS8XMV8_9BURK|nr:hypothetical protein [Pelomonas sp. P7]MCE4540595.1 hypothetical protein [Pelomonas sp. P7]
MNHRPFVIVAMLLSLLLQAASLGGRWSASNGPADTLHAVLHWSGIAHHHDHLVSVMPDDADFLSLEKELGLDRVSPHPAFHQDFSADSNHHLGQDACLGAIGPIPTALVPAFAVAGETQPALLLQAGAPDPFLAGLRRPPRRLA